jgi:hypothetical protein
MNRPEFVKVILDLYLDLPDTPKRFNRFDRSLAASWFDQGISILQIQHAMTLAQVRRASRPSADPPLGPIRSLHYFAPVLREIILQPLPTDYFRYLQRKLLEINARKPD